MAEKLTFRAYLIITLTSIFIIISINFSYSNAAAAPVDQAFLHLTEVMDKYHTNFDVYTDLSSAGNHFVTLGKTYSAGGQDMIEIDPGYTSNCYSGDTCVENRFISSGDNWGGWYFMNGVLEGEETQPKLNWGDYPDAGVDLTGATKLTFRAKGQNGGERVEFFAFGVGRNALSGIPFKPYPDLSPKVSLGYITLTTAWTEYTIDLTGVDLTYVLGGFGWVSNAQQNNNQNITFYLDDIKYDKSRLDEPRFLVSYETISSGADFDTVMKNTAYTYDNALALLAFLARGTADDIRRAGLIADAFVYAMNNDRYFTDGRLRNAYQGGDLVLPPGWKANNRENTVRMPGWFDPVKYEWLEDEFNVSTHTGNIAWSIIALTEYYKHAGGNKYLEAAINLGEWIEGETRDSRCNKGYTGGKEGWEQTGNRPEGQTVVLWKSTEHNIDVYAALKRLYELTGNVDWLSRALYARFFAESMWNTGGSHFWTGTLEDGCTINTANIPVDIQAWALMAFSKYGEALGWAENNGYTQCDGFSGFDFNNDNDGVWFEGTAQMAVAYQLNNEQVKSAMYIDELRTAQTSGPNANGKGIIAACRDTVSTGFDWEYFSRLHVGATAWYIFAELGHNPYWGMDITDNPPVIEDVSVKGCFSELCQSYLIATASDPNQGNLTFSWTPLNGGEIIGSGPSVQFDPPDSGPHPCPYYVRLTVTSDASGLQTEYIVKIFVKLAGDVNGDGIVNLMDKLLVRNHYGEVKGDFGWDEQADVNCDGVVNLMDKLIVRKQYGRTDGCACRFPPEIDFTYVPPWRSYDNLMGLARNVASSDFNVAVYIKVDNGWWTKPYFAWPLTAIQSNLSWTTDITTGGHDQDATEISAFLIPNWYVPPAHGGAGSIREELYEYSASHVSTARDVYYRTISFSGYNWTIKTSSSVLGPGPNYFSDSADNVWVDGQGQLHLKITKRNNTWYCAEVVSQQSFGYGKYLFYLNSRVDQLDPNVVLGLFTWDTINDPMYGNREIDIEFSKWGDSSNLNSQYVVQPYNVPGNMYRFNTQLVNTESVHYFEWRSDYISFKSLFGFDPDSTDLINSFNYAGSDNPLPGSENARINLWLMDGHSPTDGQEVEVVINKFEFIP